MFGVKPPTAGPVSLGFPLFSRVWRARYLGFLEKRSDNIGVILRIYCLNLP